MILGHSHSIDTLPLFICTNFFLNVLILYPCILGGFMYKYCVCHATLCQLTQQSLAWMILDPWSMSPIPYFPPYLWHTCSGMKGSGVILYRNGVLLLPSRTLISWVVYHHHESWSGIFLSTHPLSKIKSAHPVLDNYSHFFKYWTKALTYELFQTITASDCTPYLIEWGTQCCILVLLTICPSWYRGQIILTTRVCCANLTLQGWKRRKHD